MRVNSEPIQYKEGERSASQQDNDCGPKAPDHRASHTGGANRQTTDGQREAAPKTDGEASQSETTFHELQQEVHNKRKAGMRYEAMRTSLLLGYRSRVMLVGVSRGFPQEGCMSRAKVRRR